MEDRPFQAAPYFVHTKNLNEWITAFFVALIIFFPPATHFLFDVSSMAIGLIIAAFVVMLVFFTTTTKIASSPAVANQFSLAIFIPIIVLVHVVIASLIRPVEMSRSIQSLLILAFIIFAAPQFGELLFNRSRTNINKAVDILCIIFSLIAVMSILGIQPPAANNGSKPVFPFNEPSFFAFTILPIITYKCVTSNFISRTLCLIAVLVFAVIVKNLTLVVGCALVGLVVLPLRFVVPMIAIGFYALNFVELSYFTERLDITSDSDNISALVYAQGWQLLDESLRHTKGWGLGFQQLGFGYTNVPASFRLFYILRRDSNLVDGGFLLAKAGSEFGVFGIMAVGVITAYAVKSMVILRSVAMGWRVLDPAVVLALCSSYSIVLEIYVRGVGYFTGTTFLAISAALYLWRVPNLSLRASAANLPKAFDR